MPISDQGASPKARPIIFSAPMVRAMLEGRKTQTRRLVKKPDQLPPRPQEYQHNGWAFYQQYGNGVFSWPFRCPYGQPGDFLWSRETWTCYRQTSYEYNEWEQVFSAEEREEYNGTLSPVYQADEKSYPERWNPSIHMPRWASRLTLELTGVRVERLQEISEVDAVAEGVVNVGRRDGAPYDHYVVPGLNLTVEHEPQPVFAAMWESINGDGSWNINPWVWVLEFSVHRQNVDALLAARAAA